MNNNTSVPASICAYILHLKSSERARRVAVTPCPLLNEVPPRRRRSGVAESDPEPSCDGARTGNPLLRAGLG